MRQFTTYPYARGETVEENWITATYQITGTGYDAILKGAGNFAIGQTVGTWVAVPGISEKMIQERQGRVVGLYPNAPDQKEECPTFILQISFPLENFGGSISMMLTALLGNDVSTSLPCRLLDISFGKGIGNEFTGPQKGMEDWRRLCKVEEKRPLVLNMIKPCTGFTPEEGAKLFFQVAKGGVDLIKDDELLGSPHYNQLEKRVKIYLETARQVAEETGKEPVYLPNIGGTPGQMMENAKAVVQAGGKACLVPFVFGGYDALLEVCQKYNDQLFIMGHYAGSNIFAGQRCGVDDSVSIGLLPRLAGASAIMTPAPAKPEGESLYHFCKTVQAESMEIPWLSPSVVTVGGGITPVNQRFYQRMLGPDCIIGIGGAIQGHPMGAEQGAKAAMVAVQATAKGESLEQAALTSPALAKALELWEEE